MARPGAHLLTCDHDEDTRYHDEKRTQVYSYEGEITFVHLEDENEEVPIAKLGKN